MSVLVLQTIDQCKSVQLATQVQRLGLPYLSIYFALTVAFASWFALLLFRENLVLLSLSPLSLSHSLSLLQHLRSLACALCGIQIGFIDLSLSLICLSAFVFSFVYFETFSLYFHVPLNRFDLCK